MPYNIRKRKCKQSDGDSGTYVLSYTDKKGKKHNNCHTSKKKAQGQIAAIEGPREMDELDEVDPMAFGGGGMGSAEEEEAEGFNEVAAVLDFLMLEMEQSLLSEDKDAARDLAKKIAGADPEGFVQLATSSGIKNNGKGPGFHIRLKPNNKLKLDPDVDRVDAFEIKVQELISGTPGLEVSAILSPGSEGSASGKYKTLKLQYDIAGQETPVDLVLQTGRKESGKPGDIPNFFLGIISEYATIDGLNGGNQFDTAVTDNLVNTIYLAMTPTQQDMIRRIYDECVVCASKAFNGRQKPEGSAVPGNASAAGGEGTSTSALVDVLVKKGEEVTGDIHVKFNDLDRLIGLQATGADGKKVIMNLKSLERELDKSWPASAQYKHLRNQFAKNILLPKMKVEIAPGKSAISQADAAGIELNMFQDRETRREFLSFLEESGLPAKIEEELGEFLKEAGMGKGVYFFKYRTKPPQPNFGKAAAVSLDIEQITGDSISLEIVTEWDDDTTYPYTILYNGKPIFRIEARTSGQGHPMQVKGVSKDLIDKYQSVNPDEISVDTLTTGVADALSEMSEKWSVSAGTVEPSAPVSEALVRAAIRESLLIEELTGRDKEEIRKIAKKEAEKIASRKEIEKVFKRQFDKELKKALGNSFFGTPGKINKFVKDEIAKEIRVMFNDKMTKNQIADLTKAVMKKLYRELSFSSVQIMDRIKL